MKLTILSMKPFLFFLLLTYGCDSYGQTNIQNDTTAQELQGVVIPASPYKASRQMPISYSRVDSSLIRLMDYGAEPSIMLQRFPGITFQSDNGTNFGYSYFRFRGLDQSRINITINGMPLNEPEDAGTYFSNFPSLLSNATSVQLQRGIGMSKNGAPAFAGSLDFETKQLRDRHTEIGIEAGSFSSGRLYAEQQSGNEKNLIFYKLNLLTTDGYKYHSGNNSASGIFQWQHQSGKTFIQTLTLIGKNRNGLGWLGVNDSAAKTDFKSNGNTEREKGNFSQWLQQFHLTIQARKNQNFHAGLFYNYTKGDYGFDLNNFLYLPGQGPLLHYRTYSSWGGLLLDYQFTGKNFSLTSGIYGSLCRKVHNAVQDLNAALMYHNYGDKNELSPFVKFIFHRNGFYFFTDMQYRYATFSYHGNVCLKNFQWNFFNPLAGVGCRLNNHVYLYVNTGHIKREPGRNDIFLGNDNLQKDNNGQAVYVDLQPENNFSIEAGVRYENHNLQGSLNLYRMKILNAIDLNGQIGPTGLPLHSNVAKAIRAGAELEMSYQFSSSWTVYQSFSLEPHYIAEENKHSTPVLTPEVISYSEIRYSIPHWNFVLDGRYQSKSYIDFANNYQLPAATTINFLAKYYVHKFFLTLRLLNIINQKIYSSGQLNVYGQAIYQVQAPFNFIVGAGIGF
ncbi:MAG: TonB-dependent receptor [Proteobacteria bacterium]|nr:TonB-dependent receptor [Pseudomonadota bacterium]MBS1920493.1 TonB-dependent receptor [Bacteroidota bacterium]MBS1931108.1 TonB-dependent receptor [Bacteroidota bacterium]